MREKEACVLLLILTLDRKCPLYYSKVCQRQVLTQCYLSHQNAHTVKPVTLDQSTS